MKTSENYVELRIYDAKGNSIESFQLDLPCDDENIDDFVRAELPDDQDDIGKGFTLAAVATTNGLETRQAVKPGQAEKLTKFIRSVNRIVQLATMASDDD